MSELISMPRLKKMLFIIYKNMLLGCIQFFYFYSLIYRLTVGGPWFHCTKLDQ